MFNVGGPEFVVILIVALVVLGPTRLPGALRELGRLIGEAKKLSTNFQNEVNEAMADPVKKVTGVEGPDLSKLPRSSRDLVDFAVPAPFAAMDKKEEPADGEGADADPSLQNGESTTAAASVAEPVLDPHSPEANGMTPDGASADSAATTVANGTVASAAVANAAAANAAATANRVEPAVLPPQARTAPTAPPANPIDSNASGDDDGDEVPMFGDR